MKKQLTTTLKYMIYSINTKMSTVDTGPVGGLKA